MPICFRRSFIRAPSPLFKGHLLNGTTPIHCGLHSSCTPPRLYNCIIQLYNRGLIKITKKSHAISRHLRPFQLHDARALYQQCVDFYGGVIPDSVRRYEWPFCDEFAALDYGVSLLANTVDDLPGAYAYVDDDDHCIALVSVSFYERRDRSVLLGTYLTPRIRQKGFHRTVKTALFTQLAEHVDTYYCIVSAANPYAIRALLQMAAEQISEQAVICAIPLRIQLEHALQQPAALFRLEPRQWTDCSAK